VGIKTDEVKGIFEAEGLDAGSYARIGEDEKDGVDHNAKCKKQKSKCNGKF
jgi:hypothetical protein